MSIQVHLRTLAQLYRQTPLSDISEAGFRVFSQDDEDGILHYIFSRIGTTNKVCVEIAYPKPEGGNTTNLIVNCGWLGLLVCAKEKEVANVRKYYEHNQDVLYHPVVTQSWITRENVDQVIGLGIADLAVSFPNDTPDLVSIDIDGMDYWIWKAMMYRPRVVVIEYHRALGMKSVVVPYNPLFDRNKGNEDYRSASLPALVKLGKQSGYTLVACSRLNLNAFFVRNDVCKFPEFPIERGLSHPITAQDMGRLGNSLDKYPWQEV